MHDDPASIAASPAPPAPGSRALLQVIERDAAAPQSFAVAHWPLRVGRALDNEVVLIDPHVAAHHLRIETEPESGALTLVVGDTRNGVRLMAHGRERWLRAGERIPLDRGATEPIALLAGRTRLLLRLPEHTLEPEQLIAPAAPLARRAVPVMLAALLVLGGLLFRTYLDTDPDGLVRSAGATLMSALVGAAVWCGAWALLSKTFTRHARFAWHLRVLLFAALGLLVTSTLPALLAFALSWPWLTDFAFVGDIAVAAAALYFHLLAVEPARHRLLKWVAAVCAFVGIGLMLWFNVQRSDMFGDELYMSHLFPPGLRIARPVGVDAFVDGLAPLKNQLDRKTKEAGRGDDDASDGDDE